MSEHDFSELVKRKFAEFERENGRVPSLHELAEILNIDLRILAQKLEESVLMLGSDNPTEGTSAFKSSLKELLSGGLLLTGWPSRTDLRALLQDAYAAPRRSSMLRWSGKNDHFVLFVRVRSSETQWVLFHGQKLLFTYETENVSDVFLQLELLKKSESPIWLNLKSSSSDNIIPFRKPPANSDE